MASLGFISRAVQVLDITQTDRELNGFSGGFQDGTYGYLVPSANGACSGKVVRFKLDSFGDVQVLDLTQTDHELKGFRGGFQDGTYGYLVTSTDGACSGKVVRFKLDSFGDVQVLDLTQTDRELWGFRGGFQDGTYGYLVPCAEGACSGKVVRFKLDSFGDVQVLDLTQTDHELNGFSGGFQDGTYGYLVPFSYGACSGKVVRFKLDSFGDVQVLDLTQTDRELKGFCGGFQDGTYGYLVTSTYGACSGKVVRLNFAIDEEPASHLIVIDQQEEHSTDIVQNSGHECVSTPDNLPEPFSEDSRMIAEPVATAANGVASRPTDVAFWTPDCDALDLPALGDVGAINGIRNQNEEASDNPQVCSGSNAPLTTSGFTPNPGEPRNLETSIGRKSNVALKLKYQDDFIRVRMPFDESILPRISYEHFEQLIRSALDLQRYFRARYLDAEGDLCLFCKASLTDFLATAALDASSCLLLKLVVDCNGSTEQLERREISERVAHGHFHSDKPWDEMSESKRSTDSDTFEFVQAPENKCFLKQTLLPIGDLEYKTAHSAKVGDKVRSVTGKELEVAFVKLHPRELQNIVSLRTAQAELSVTMEHRILVPDGARQYKEVTAKALKVGDYVLCGSRPQRLTKVLQHECNVELVEIRFNPDDPVEARVAPRWGILTKGEPAPFNVQALGPLGPFQVVPASASNAVQRSRSSGP